jgi:hypothetical protein
MAYLFVPGKLRLDIETILLGLTWHHLCHLKLCLTIQLFGSSRDGPSQKKHPVLAPMTDYKFNSFTTPTNGQWTIHSEKNPHPLPGSSSVNPLVCKHIGLQHLLETPSAGFFSWINLCWCWASSSSISLCFFSLTHKLIIQFTVCFRKNHLILGDCLSRQRIHIPDNSKNPDQVSSSQLKWTSLFTCMFISSFMNLFVVLGIKLKAQWTVGKHAITELQALELRIEL